MDTSIKFYESHSNGFIKVTLFSITYSKKIFKHFSFYLLTFLSWTIPAPHLPSQHNVSFGHISIAEEFLSQVQGQ